jgi:hypothetical protein
MNDLDPERRLPSVRPIQARTDFAIIEDELEAIYARLAKIPTRSETLRLALGCLAAVVVALLLIRLAFTDWVVGWPKLFPSF